MHSLSIVWGKEEIEKGSIAQILEAILEESKSIPLDRIIIGGISRGDTTANIAFLCNYDFPFAIKYIEFVIVIG